MKKYDVHLYFHSSVHVSVNAKNEEEAIEIAREIVDEKEIIANLDEDDDPDVVEIKTNKK